ncbi:hypothetical protein [Aureibacter tunicatorum]|uniref:Uncharacterized protein n=1 Tax=Aureibacter tunicatorum TaxID=866807 RepID=A0AAE3XKZ8_9BACT|nr:hypothetical protein [Aureibacter tunicatorum]MDR6238802.1 hypothetical protein [Aureibacter tunicatorum]BDD05270.1 hypothetical protein AUTU_27530 [Aureibacter tunicatorum]
MEEYKTDQIEPANIQGQIIIFDFGLTLDGGTISFYCQNNGKLFWIKLVQHVDFTEPFEDGWVPGALYLNEKMIDIDSLDEKKIIEGLKNCKISEKLYKRDNSENPLLNNKKTIVFGDNLNKQFDAWRKSPRHAVEQFISDSIEFIESKEYREVAIRVGRIK